MKAPWGVKKSELPLEELDLVPPDFYKVTEQPISGKESILQQTLPEDDCRGLPKLHFLLVQLFEIL